MKLSEFNSLMPGDILKFSLLSENTQKYFFSFCGFKTPIRSGECMVVVEKDECGCKVHIVHLNGSEDLGYLHVSMEKNALTNLCKIN